MWVAAAFARREALRQAEGLACVVCGPRRQDMTAARLRSLLPADVPMLLPGPGAPVPDAARAALRTLAKEEET